MKSHIIVCTLLLLAARRTYTAHIDTTQQRNQTSPTSKPRPYPLGDEYLRQTQILDKTSYLVENHLDDHQWYLDNIPFVDVPDAAIQAVYYYRTSVIKRHLKYTHQGHGWIFTEFIQPVGWASKFGTVTLSSPIAALESRWLRDITYGKDLCEHFSRGGLEDLSGISYSNFMIHACERYAQVTGDKEWLVSNLDGFVHEYTRWDGQIDNKTNLYFQTPLLDGQEYSLPGYLVGGPGGGPMQEWNQFGLTAEEGWGNDYNLIWEGPDTYRPSLNAFMVASARTIANVADMAGRSDVASQWTARADHLNSTMTEILWDADLAFWTDVIRGSNTRADGRQLVGYYPYYFGLGTNQSFISGLEKGLDHAHFLAEFGPTSLEKVNPYFTALKNSTACCLWQGQSWPFSTSFYLNTLAMMAREGVSELVTPSFWFEQFQTYTRTNMKNGEPYTAESHYPEIDWWSADSHNYSENYLHSTYVDNFFANLLGIDPTLDDEFVLKPLVPQDWTHFAVENLPYHGTLLSIVWDAEGSHYGCCDSGLTLFSNGTKFHHQSVLGDLRVPLPFDSREASTALGLRPQWQNILANPNSPWGYPVLGSDLQSPHKLNDGLLWYDQPIPDNFWTTNNTLLPVHAIWVNLTRPRRMRSVSIAVLAEDDVEHGGTTACPHSIEIRDHTGDVVLVRNPWDECTPNSLNTIPFEKPGLYDGSNNASNTAERGVIETDFLNITVSDKQYYSIAFSELQIWVEPTSDRWEVEDGVIGTFIGGFEAGRPRGLNGTIMDGGVRLGVEGWVELAGVRTKDGLGGNKTMTVYGGGYGTVDVGLNWQGQNDTLVFNGESSKILDVALLRGNNVVTFFQREGSPWLDAFEISE